MRKCIEERTLKTAKISARRSRSIINDIIACNTFNYFVTLTLGTQDRLDDSHFKSQWHLWQVTFRKKYPNAYYIGVPEYHKKGGLHIHLCIGGITAEELQLLDSNFVCCHWTKKKYLNKTAFNAQKDKHELLVTDGTPIYNVGAWTLGFSTATEIKFQYGVATYITKYISKGGIDPRFCDAKRYWCSKNLVRPTLEKSRELYIDGDTLESLIDVYPMSFGDLKNAYYVFEMPTLCRK